MNAEEYLKGLNEHDPVWDTAEEYEYTEQQLINFAERYHERKLKILRLQNVMHRFSTPEKMAEWLHNNYEEIALNNGWKTQEDCQVPFCDLPTENRLTMIELCIRYLNGA